MTQWSERSREERVLLNPALCAILLWQAARGHRSFVDEDLAFEEAFVVLAFVLHRPTREALPRTTRTSMVVWLQRNPLVRGRVVSRARLLVPYTKEALTFGAVRGLIRLEGGGVQAVESWQKQVEGAVRSSSEEVRSCAKRAELVGKWFASAGSAPTVFALLGARP